MPQFAPSIDNQGYKAHSLAIKLDNATLITLALEQIISDGICQPHDQRDIYISSSLLLEDYKKCLQIEEQKIARLHEQMARIQQDDASIPTKAFETWVDGSLNIIDRITHKLGHMEQLLSLSGQISQAS